MLVNVILEQTTVPVDPIKHTRSIKKMGWAGLWMGMNFLKIKGKQSFWSLNVQFAVILVLH
jgi:hypothetical protein